MKRTRKDLQRGRAGIIVDGATRLAAIAEADGLHPGLRRALERSFDPQALRRTTIARTLVEGPPSEWRCALAALDGGIEVRDGRGRSTVRSFVDRYQEWDERPPSRLGDVRRVFLEGYADRRWTVVSATVPLETARRGRLQGALFVRLDEADRPDLLVPVFGGGQGEPRRLLWASYRFPLGLDPEKEPLSEASAKLLVDHLQPFVGRRRRRLGAAFQAAARACFAALLEAARREIEGSE